MLSLSDIVNVKVGIGRGVFEAPGATVIGGKKPSFNLEILKLFANGEQGFWYDPNDLSTMFQDAAGAVPVTGVGQPVGLMLDKSKGLVLGSNQISYPNSEELPASVNMSDGAYTWTLNTNAPISGTQDSRLVVTVPVFCLHLVQLAVPVLPAGQDVNHPDASSDAPVTAAHHRTVRGTAAMVAWPD